MEIKSEQPLNYSAKTPKPANASFGMQVSPQATADRIVRFSTAFFGQYQVTIQT
ncbi:hypothetical protein [Methylobacter svalbardensis]|uniref:hypothetical protein n=1 Tax=Methylobacter svalbardensis TaxID=3080016 RepID=UPI0030ECDDAB